MYNSSEKEGDWTCAKCPSFSGKRDEPLAKGICLEDGSIKRSGSTWSYTGACNRFLKNKDLMKIARMIESCPECKTSVIWIATDGGNVPYCSNGCLDHFPRGKSSDVIVVHLTYADGSKRKFCAPGTLAPEELVNKLIKSLALLEECSVGWTGADDIVTITELLIHALEKHQIKEVEDEEILINGTIHWSDPSIFGG